MLSYLLDENRKKEMDLGPLEIIVVLAIVVMVFGVGKLPQVGGAIGKGIREFRKASTGEDEDAPQIEEPDAAPPAIPTRDAFCTRCGTAAPPEVRFCTACGNPVTRPANS
jgi:sec-independent protein translocase protein TatA